MQYNKIQAFGILRKNVNIVTIIFRTHSTTFPFFGHTAQHSCFSDTAQHSCFSDTQHNIPVFRTQHNILVFRTHSTTFLFFGHTAQHSCFWDTQHNIPVSSFRDSSLSWGPVADGFDVPYAFLIPFNIRCNLSLYRILAWLQNVFRDCLAVVGRFHPFTGHEVP